MLPIAFLTDYGDDDESAGACRLVIERLAPGARVVELTHRIPRGDVRRGALALEAAAAKAGPAVYLAVVDPDVGTSRRGLALAAGESFLVGPDNGLLGLVAGRLGGVREAVDVTATALRLEPVAPTFHGRDVFAPVAAHLAAGRPLAAAGEALDPTSLERLELPRAKVTETNARVHVLYVDRFGNVVLDAEPGQLDALLQRGSVRGTAEPRSGQAGPLRVEAPAGAFALRLGATFADAGGEGLVLYEDSSGRLALAVYGGSAAELLDARRDAELVIAPKP